ncbi:hypothetical protein [Pseudomonas sp. PDM13]|uniref:hypothetical protein n=1 Tax=Pseudomonas sp. PDM13 TaxID=2769255 RepID=UPI0021E002C3|nr:hypothetical protein [Pseudomonas sp. PDM13]MCU9946062.1 hypothetical protein [Pseudomonas sp. PDM13]
MATKFNVNFEVDDMQGKTVLVFLKPQNPQRNYQIHAWQVLTGSAGTTETFDYEAVISTDVATQGSSLETPLMPGVMHVIPGRVFPLEPGELLSQLEQGDPRKDPAE